MSVRSQHHKAQVHGYKPNFVGILPDTATIAAAGAVGRTVATLSSTGGTPPVTFSIFAAGGLAAAITGNLLQTTVNPCGTVGAKTVGITARDSIGKTLTENIVVTLT
jgi:hypothetical protein